MPSTAPATNPVSIIVTDQPIGAGSLSATQSFTITVFLPPQLNNFSLNSDKFIYEIREIIDDAS